MSAVSAILKIAGGIIFAVFLVTLVVTNSTSSFTEHDNLQSLAMTIAASQLQFPQMNAAQFAQFKTAAASLCSQAGRTSINLKELSADSPDATLTCSEIAAARSTNDIAESIAAGMFDAIYYRNYSCSFISCLSTLPEQEKALMFASAHANAFFKQMMFAAVAGMLVGAAIVVIAIRKPLGIARVLGMSMIISSVIGFVLVNLAKGMLPAGAAVEPVASVINGLFGSISSNFTAVLVIGIVLTAAGFLGYFVKNKKSEKPRKKAKR
jgi:hypothetical protein